MMSSWPIVYSFFCHSFILMNWEPERTVYSLCVSNNSDTVFGKEDLLYFWKLWLFFFIFYFKGKGLSALLTTFLGQCIVYPLILHISTTVLNLLLELDNLYLIVVTSTAIDGFYREMNLMLKLAFFYPLLLYPYVCVSKYL